LFRYSPDEEVLLYASLQARTEPELREFADRIFASTPDNPIAYLNTLTAEIHGEWSHIIREEENLWTPQATFEARKGSCRDLSWMLIHMLRMQGLAARFVSGYAFNPELDEGNELHAWVETYLPGAGWLGLDPSLGLFADQNYIPLATSSFAQRTLPVHGNYGGTAGARLRTEVNIQQLADAGEARGALYQAQQQEQ
jgi:transglutaminase-like putative cysteine protease